MPTMPAARVRAGTAAACGALALIAACSGAPDRAPSASPSSQATGLAGQAGPQPAATTALAAQLAPAQARQAFEAFFPRFDAMVTHHRVARVPRLTVGAEEQVRAFGTRHGTGLPPLAQESERFYVPRVTSYPRWFVEEAATHSHGAAGGDAFVMVQSRRGGPWQEADTLTWSGPRPAQLSGISVSHGYATTVFPDHASLAVSPGQLPGQYTRLISRTADAASSPFAASDATTGWIASQQKVVKGAPSKGWQVSFGFSAPAIPAYALRTTSGGAVVFFAFGQASTWTARSSAPKFSAAANSFDGRMPLEVALEAGLSSPAVRPGTKFASSYVFESAALDPPRGQGKVSLLPSALDGGGITSAAKVS